MAGKTSGKRNRRAGHGLETLVARLLVIKGFLHVITSRAGNRSRDNAGVDLVNADEVKNGRLEYNIQCKCTTDRPKYDQILGSMPKDENVINVIIHKFTKRSGTKFMPLGHFAIMEMNDFLEMAAEIKRLKTENKKLSNPSNDSSY